MIVPGSYMQGFAPRDFAPAHPELLEGCVASWSPHLGPSGSSLFDWSGRKRHGELTGFTLSSAWVVAEKQHSLSFAGGSEYVDCGETFDSFLGTADRGMYSWWVRPASTSNMSWFGRGSNDFGGGPQFVGLLYNGSLYAGWWDNGIGEPRVVVAIGSTTVVAGEWQHYAVTWVVGGTTTLYRNGLVIGTQSSCPSLAPVRSHAIGYPIFGGAPTFSGQMGEHRYYNRVLTPNQIASLAQRPGIAYEWRTPVRTIEQAGGGSPPVTIRRRVVRFGV